MTVNPLITNSANKEASKRDAKPDRTLFLYTLIADFIFLIAAMVFGWGYFITGSIAGVIMLPYCLIAFRHAEKTGAYDQLGDSCYYLGFLLTLVGLAISLFDLGQGAEGGNAADGVVARFGAAIITTLVGMIARIFIAQFSTFSVGSPEQAEARLSDGMFRVANELDASVKQFENIRKTTVNNINQATKAAETRMNKAAELQISITEQLSSEAFKRHEAILENLENSLSNIVVDTTPIKSGLEDVIGTIERQMNRLNNVLTKLGNAGEETEKKWTDLKDQLDLIATSLDAFSKSGGALKETSENFQHFVKHIDEVTESFAGTQQIVESLSGVLNGSDSMITAVKMDIQANLEDVQTLRKMVIAEHSSAADATDEVFKRLSAALELINNKLAITDSVRG
jgi:hypothetical protein